jgi:hypothetical protein
MLVLIRIHWADLCRAAKNNQACSAPIPTVSAAAISAAIAASARGMKKCAFLQCARLREKRILIVNYPVLEANRCETNATVQDF